MAKVVKQTSKTGVTRFVVDYFTPEKQRLRKYFSLKKEADAYLGKVLAAKKEGRYHDVFDMKQESLTTFKVLADKYVENFKTQKCFAGFKSHVIRDLREAFGDQLLSQITYLSLETWRNRRKATPTKLRKTRADASVNCDMAILGHMMSKAVEWGLLENSPFKKGKRLMFKIDNQRRRFLTEAEIVTLLNECPRHLKPIVETALHTGMRREEILSLKWEQINHGFIYLEGGMVKSGKGRQIPINEWLTEVFKEVRRGNQLKSEFVFCDAQGRRFQEVRTSFNGACRRAGIRDFTFHDLRHTFASRLVMNGVGLKAVQELLGHADLTMTMRYAHLSQGHLQEAVAVLSGLRNVSAGKVDSKMTVEAQKSQGAVNLTIATH
jgi:integrase